MCVYFFLTFKLSWSEYQNGGLVVEPLVLLFKPNEIIQVLYLQFLSHAAWNVPSSLQVLLLCLRSGVHWGASQYTFSTLCQWFKWCILKTFGGPNYVTIKTGHPKSQKSTWWIEFSTVSCFLPEIFLAYLRLITICLLLWDKWQVISDYQKN